MNIDEIFDGAIENISHTTLPLNAHDDDASNIASGINVHTKGDVDGVASSYALLATIVVISLRLEKHTRDIGSPLLSKMGYDGGGLGQSR